VSKLSTFKVSRQEAAAEPEGPEEQKQPQELQRVSAIYARTPPELANQPLESGVVGKRERKSEGSHLPTKSIDTIKCWLL
jgi:hypothetical protein